MSSTVARASRQRNKFKLLNLNNIIAYLLLSAFLRVLLECVRFPFFSDSSKTTKTAEKNANWRLNGKQQVMPSLFRRWAIMAAAQCPLSSVTLKIAIQFKGAKERKRKLLFSLIFITNRNIHLFVPLTLCSLVETHWEAKTLGCIHWLNKSADHHQDHPRLSGHLVYKASLLLQLISQQNGGTHFRHN